MKRKTRQTSILTRVSVFPATSEWKELDYQNNAKYFQPLRRDGFITKDKARELLAPHK